MSMPETSPLLDALAPSQVAAFLCRKGWKKEHYPNPDLLVFTSPEGDGASIVLPARANFADYPAKLRDCIRCLSAANEIDVPTLIHHIAHWDRDILTVRLESPLGKDQLLPLDYAAQLIAKYRDFVAFAAATETDPRKFFSKLTGSGREFVEHCVFGHTFVGSFGLTIECPLDLEAELPMPDMPPPRPFRRAVTERIAAGYTSVVAAAAADDPEVIIRNHSTGFSGNMCEILADIYEMSEGYAVSNRMIWCPELRPPQHLLAAEQPLGINEESYRVLKAAAQALQTVDEPDEDKVIVGRITRLRSEQPPVAAGEFEASSRTIVVLWEIEKRQPLAVHVELPLALYRLACDAHKNGQLVKISGKPKKVGKFWQLQEHHDFEVV